jgi:hypothetical protein
MNQTTAILLFLSAYLPKALIGSSLLLLPKSHVFSKISAPAFDSKWLWFVLILIGGEYFLMFFLALLFLDSRLGDKR